MQFGKRAGDHTADAVLQMQRAMTAGQLQQVAADIDRVLEKLEEGTYGSVTSVGSRSAKSDWRRSCGHFAVCAARRWAIVAEPRSREELSARGYRVRRHRRSAATDQQGLFQRLGLAVRQNGGRSSEPVLGRLRRPPTLSFTRTLERDPARRACRVISQPLKTQRLARRYRRRLASPAALEVFPGAPSGAGPAGRGWGQFRPGDQPSLSDIPVPWTTAHRIATPRTSSTCRPFRDWLAVSP